MNFFALFGFEEAFDIDLSRLSNTYKSLAQVTHPDKFSQASDSEKLMAVQKSAQVNDGYQVLKHPLSRAEHLLSIRGIQLSHETKTLQDPAFLMQQMEWREQLEDVEHAADQEAALETLDKELQQHSQAQYVELQSLLEVNSDESDIKAADKVRKLKFMEKLHHEIELKEDALFDE